MSKNPKRVAAGKVNRAKRGPLSAETKQKLSEAAKQHRPWEHATGPRTSRGKAASAQNGAHFEPRKPVVIDECVLNTYRLLRQTESSKQECYPDLELQRFAPVSCIVAQLQELLLDSHAKITRRQADDLLRECGLDQPSETPPESSG